MTIVTCASVLEMSHLKDLKLDPAGAGKSLGVCQSLPRTVRNVGSGGAFVAG